MGSLEVRTPIEDFFTQNQAPILINEPTEIISAKNQKTLLGPWCVEAGNTIDFSAMVVQDRTQAANQVLGLVANGELIAKSTARDDGQPDNQVIMFRTTVKEQTDFELTIVTFGDNA